MATNHEINKYLTEAMGICFWIDHDEEKCGCVGKAKRPSCINFFTWEGFGKLLTFVRSQKWLPDFLELMDAGSSVIDGHGHVLFEMQSEFIDPETFATAVYEFLKEN